MLPAGGAPGRGNVPPSQDLLDTPPPAPWDQASATRGMMGMGGGGMGQPGSGGGQPGMGDPSAPGSALASLTPGSSTGAMGLTTTVAQMDQQLLALAQAAPLMSAKLGQARALLAEALSEFLQATMAGPEVAGSQFPGGGFGSGQF